MSRQSVQSYNPADNFFTDVLDHFPLTWNDFERLGDVFAEFGKPRRAAAGAGGWPRNDHALARQMIWKRFADRLAACVRRNERGRLVGLGRGFLGCDLVFGGRGFKVFQLQFHLIEELAAAFRAAVIKLPPHLLDGEFEMGNQRLGTRNIGRRTRWFCLGARSLFLRANARGSFNGKQPFEASKSSGRLSISGVMVTSGAQIA
jgi:hypothetical protein